MHQEIEHEYIPHYMREEPKKDYSRLMLVAIAAGIISIGTAVSVIVQNGGVTPSRAADTAVKPVVFGAGERGSFQCSGDRIVVTRKTRTTIDTVCVRVSPTSRSNQ